MTEIYEPKEDSFFFEEFLDSYFKKIKTKELKYLDMGTGSGILGLTALKNKIKKENILCSDINNEAIELIIKKGLNGKVSDLFKNISGKFDLITFNAPYLPEDKLEPKSSKLITTGGKRGDEISLKFLKQAKEYLKVDGKIFLLISSLTPFEKIEKFNPKIVARKKIFFEELLILELCN